MLSEPPVFLVFLCDRFFKMTLPADFLAAFLSVEIVRRIPCIDTLSNKSLNRTSGHLQKELAALRELKESKKDSIKEKPGFSFSQFVCEDCVDFTTRI